jgi:hypothetical protein
MSTRKNNLKVTGRWFCASIAAALIAGSLVPNVAPAAPAAQLIPDDPAFQQVRNRTDQPVQLLKVKRSYYWGNFVHAPFYERYDQGPKGQHLVHYFEKARMEINNPNADRSNPFFVTNG